MPKTLPTLFALLVVAASACAAPQIVGDSTVKPGGFALLRLTGAKAAMWDVSPDPIQADEIAGALVFTANPGTYQVKAIIGRIVDGEIVFERVKFVVVFQGGPGPAPVPPGPGPAPPSPISPFAKRLQDAAAADGMPRADLAKLSEVVGRAGYAFAAGMPAGQVHDAAKAELAKGPRWGKHLAAIFDEQVTATLEPLKNRDTPLPAETAKSAQTMFTALAAALLEASKQ